MADTGKSEKSCLWWKCWGEDCWTLVTVRTIVHLQIYYSQCEIPKLMFTHFEFFSKLNFINKWYSSSWSPPSEVLPPLGGLHNWVWIPIAGWTSFGIDFNLVRTACWEFFTVGQFQFGKITKWMNHKLVGYQFGSFTMGVNLKKVNIHLEFVTERYFSDHDSVTCILGK